MADLLDDCLADLQVRIDEAQEQRNLEAWQGFLEGRCAEPIFFPPRRRPAPARTKWPSININDALKDVDLMVLRELAMVSGQLADGGGSRLNVRCNYGTGILPSLFGCQLFVMARETDTLPAVRPLPSVDDIRRVTEAGLPALRGGLGGRVFDCATRVLELFGKYPLLGRHIVIYHPDMQGPIDTAEEIWGSGIFLAFYDEPELLRNFLEVITRTYVAFMRKWYGLIPPPNGYSTHWGLLHKGRLMIRNDSLMNLSPQVYLEFVRPLDQRLFDEFGGGAIHFCGRGSHYIEAMSAMRGLSGIQMSQPHLNDMETVYRNTVDKGIKLLNVDTKTAQAAVAAGRPLRGQVQCPA